MFLRLLGVRTSSLSHVRTFCKFARYSQERLWETLQQPAGLTPSDLTAVAYRFAQGNTEGVLHETFDFKACFRIMTENLVNFSSAEIVKVFVFCRRVRVEDEFWKSLCIAARDCADYSNADMSLLFNTFLQSVNTRLTRPYHSPERSVVFMTEKGLLQKIRNHMTENVADLDPQQITDVLKGLATLNVDDKRLLGLLCFESLVKASDFTPTQLSDSLYALSTLKFENRNLVSKFCVEAMVKVEQFQADEISLFVHSMMEFGKQEETHLIGKMCGQAKVKAKSFSGLGIARLIIALGKAGFQDKVLFQQLTSEMLHKHIKCNSTDIANLLDAFAKLGFFYKPLVRQLRMNAARVKIRQFTADEMALTFDSLRALGIDYDEFMVEKFTEQAVGQKWLARDYGVLIAAMSRYKHHHPKELLKALIEAKFFEAANFDAETIARVFHACSERKVYDDRLFNALSTAAMQFVKDFTPQQISYVMEGLASGEFFDEDLIKQLCQTAYEKYAAFKSSEVTVVLRALAVFELYDEVLVHRLCLQGMTQNFASQDMKNALKALQKLKQVHKVRP